MRVITAMVLWAGCGRSNFDLIDSSADTSRTTYASTVLADHPIGYWRLGEAAGSLAADSSGNAMTGIYGGAVTQGVSGVLANDPDSRRSSTA